MLRIFRHIRKTLTEQNKTRTYILYAMGEIVLVMVGILLALQVNNWNEARKQHNMKTELLHELHENLNASRAEIQNAISYNEGTLTNLRTILDYIENELPQDSIITTSFFTYLNWSTPYITTSAYESMKTRELLDFENDSLKASIARIYNETFAYLSSDYDRAEWQLSAEIRLPYSTKYIRYNEDNTANVINYDEMIQDEGFRNSITFVIRTRKWGLTTLNNALEDVNDLQLMIERELDMTK